MFSLRYCFWYFGTVWVGTPNVILSSCRKRLCLSAGKNSTSLPMLLWRYYKDMQTHFGYFGHSWLHSMIVSPCRRLQSLSACNYNKLHNSLLSYILKNPANWLAGSIFTYNSRPNILPDMFMKYQEQYQFSFYIISKYIKLTGQNFSKRIQNPILGGHSGTFLPKFGQKWIFLEKRAVRFSIFKLSTIVLKIRKTWAILEENVGGTHQKPVYSIDFFVEIQQILESCDALQQSQ